MLSGGISHCCHSFPAYLSLIRLSCTRYICFGSRIVWATLVYYSVFFFFNRFTYRTRCISCFGFVEFAHQLDVMSFICFPYYAQRWACVWQRPCVACRLPLWRGRQNAQSRGAGKKEVDVSQSILYTKAPICILANPF